MYKKTSSEQTQLPELQRRQDSGFFEDSASSDLEAELHDGISSDLDVNCNDSATSDLEMELQAISQGLEGQRDKPVNFDFNLSYFESSAVSDADVRAACIEVTASATENTPTTNSFPTEINPPSVIDFTTTINPPALIDPQGPIDPPVPRDNNPGPISPSGKSIHPPSVDPSAPIDHPAPLDPSEQIDHPAPVDPSVGHNDLPASANPQAQIDQSASNHSPTIINLPTTAVSPTTAHQPIGIKSTPEISIYAPIYNPAYCDDSPPILKSIYEDISSDSDPDGSAKRGGKSPETSDETDDKSELPPTLTPEVEMPCLPLPSNPKAKETSVKPAAVPHRKRHDGTSKVKSKMSKTCQVTPHSSAEIQERVKNRHRNSVSSNSNTSCSSEASKGEKLSPKQYIEGKAEPKPKSKTRGRKRKTSTTTTLPVPKKSKVKDTNLYIVEKILKKTTMYGSPYFFVKWLNYPE